MSGNALAQKNKKILWYFFTIFGLLSFLVVLFIIDNIHLATEQAAVLSFKPIKNKLPAEQMQKDVPFKGRFTSGRFDVYLPEKIENAPILVFIPGGTWQNHNKRHYQHIGVLGVRNNFITVVLNMPTFPGRVSRVFYTQKSLKKMGFRYSVQFLEEAFRGIFSHFKNTKANVRNVHLMGYDSGGFFAAMIAFKEGALDLLKPYLKSVVLLSAYTDLTSHNDRFRKQFIFPFFGSDKQTLKEESPLYYSILPKNPKFKVLNLAAEFDIPEIKNNARLFHKKLMSGSLNSTFETIPQSTHPSLIYRLGRKKEASTLAVEAFWATKKPDTVPEVKK